MMAPRDRRDLRGTWGEPDRPAPWPGKARLTVSFVLNVEEGAELPIGDGDERTKSVSEIREKVMDEPGLCMDSHFAYGPRRGYQRIVAAVAAHGVRATFSTCGCVAQRLPWLIRDAVSQGHEIGCDGWRWERHAGLDKMAEARIIADTHATIAGISRTAPVGRHTRSAPSQQTRAPLPDHGGLLYDSDCYDDDQPRVQRFGNRDHVILPCAFDTNDMRLSPGGGFVQADAFTRYVAGAFDRVYAEGGQGARMLSVGLRLRMIGRPGRIAGLEALLAHRATHPGLWFTTRADIARYWLGLGS